MDVIVYLVSKSLNYANALVVVVFLSFYQNWYMAEDQETLGEGKFSMV